MAQIGTIRVETQNNGTVSVPVFNTGDSGSSVYEFVRVQTAGGTGFIPVIDPASAAYPYIRVQSQNNGIVAVHDSASTTTSTTSLNDAIHQWKLDEGSGTSFSDNIGSASGTVNGSTWVSDTYEGGSALDGDGTDDYEEVGTLGNFGSQMDDTDFAFIATTDTTVAQSSYFAGERNSNEPANWFLTGMGILGAEGCYVTYIRTNDGSNNDSGIYTDNTYADGRHRVVFNKVTNDPSNWEYYVDGGIVSTSIGEPDSLAGAQDFDLNFRLHGKSTPYTHTYFQGILDNIIICNDSLTSTEVQDDYNNQPWS